MAAKWIKTNFPGVRYREHEKRKNGVKKDQYFTIRYKWKGKDKEEGLGWASEDWTAAKAYERRCEIRENQKTAEGPQTLKEKRKKAEETRRQVDAARQEAEKRNVTFDDFMLNTYLPQSKLDKKPKTYATEEMLYRLHMAETLGPLTFSEIKPKHLNQIKENLTTKKKSGRTIQYILQLTRQAFHRAQELDVFTGKSPTSAVTWPRLDNMKLRYLSIDEAEKLLAALALKSRGLHDQALLSLHCGLRFGEIAALTWSCVNLEQGTVAILNAKAGSRTAYLTERASAMFKARKKGRPDELIFPKRGKAAGEREQVSKSFTDTIKELGLNEGVTDRKQRVTFHTLRHTFATHLYESTHDIYLTQRSLGHASGTMTARYAKMSESRLREGAAALENTFGGKKQSGKVLPFKKRTA
jgi:integrase